MAQHDHLDLGTQIERAEQAVIERDRRFLHNSRALATRVERGFKRYFGRGVLAGAATLALAWFMPWRRHAVMPRPGASGAAAVPWAALIPVVWPLLPPAWRRRVSPSTATMAVGIALPLLSSLRPPQLMVQTAAQVDLARFAGRWYELARLTTTRGDGGVRDATVEYSSQEGVIVVEQRWRGADGRQRCRRGLAYPVDGSRGAKLELNLLPAALRWLPLSWSGHWIVHVDEDYQHAVIGTPDRKGLQVLARSPLADEATTQRLIGYAAAQGYRLDRLRRVTHSA
jgi:apolipoprotein D and lipocalin family protein